LPIVKGPKQAPETAPIGRKVCCPPLISERGIARGLYRLSDSKAKGGGNRGNKALGLQAKGTKAKGKGKR